MARAQAFDKLVPTNKPNRNPFDLSFANNFSTQFGRLTPVLCKEVIPGDTFKIKSAFGLKLMPMYFPVQTRMRARLHFFYVRNRNLWKHWKQFYRGDQNYEMPYISGSVEHMKNLFKQGGLADYLGCPTNVYSTFTTSSNVVMLPPHYNNVDDYATINSVENKYLPFWPSKCDFSQSRQIEATIITNNYLTPVVSVSPIESQYCCVLTSENTTDKLDKDSAFLKFKYDYSNVTDAPASGLMSCCILLGQYGKIDKTKLSNSVDIKFISDYISFDLNSNNEVEIGLQGLSVHNVVPSLSTTFVNAYNEIIDDNKTPVIILAVRFNNKSEKIANYLSSFNFCELSGLIVSADEELPDFYTAGNKINALPFRAYESIYNAIYRNTQNDPFKKNGVVNYDDFITNDDDGADATEYDLFQDYWEKDFLTTCLPSPQDGTAPLLGLSGNGDLTATGWSLRYTTPDGTKQQITVKRNSNTGALSFSAPAGSDEVLQGDVEALNVAGQFGISINDLRTTNSLQRWLERNIANAVKN